MLEYRSEKFTRYDSNDDGVIDAAEAREKGSKRRDYYKHRRMHVLDTNKDVSVSKDEFLAKTKEHFSMMPRERTVTSGLSAMFANASSCS